MTAITLGSLLGMFAVVAFGAVVPVVPTGAAVSVAASQASVERPLELVLVLVFGAAGAYLGDIITYGLLSLAGEPLARRVGWLSEGSAADTLASLRHKVERNELRVLLLSRLVPGGRVPVLLAAALGGYPWIRFVTADIAAAGLWSVLYALIGLVGRSIFSEPWQRAVAAIVLVLLVTAAQSLVQRFRHRRHPAD